MIDYKLYKKGYYKIFRYNYHSLDEFLDTLIKEPINYEIFKRPSSETIGKSEWYGTDSFKEAWNLCKYTYDEGYDSFRDKFNQIKYKIEHKIELVDCYKPVGSSVNIPRYLFGIPDNMRNKEEVLTKPIININFQIGYSSFTSISKIRNRGILTLALIDYLENIKKYKVNLNIFDLSKEQDEIIYIIVNLKDKNEKLKLKKCYFPIVHPSFVRRLLFRAQEIIPDLKNDWSNGYGVPVIYENAISIVEYDNIENYKNDIINSIYISTPDELGIKGINIDEDLNNFINILNNKYHIFDNKVKVKRKEYR